MSIFSAVAQVIYGCRKTAVITSAAW